MNIVVHVKLLEITFIKMTTNEVWTYLKQVLAQEKDLRYFKNWATLTSIPLYNRNDGWDFYSKDTLRLLKERQDLNLWKYAIREPIVGHTETSYSHIRKFINEMECSTWTLKAANHLLQYEKLSGKSIYDYEQIVEFGAGIGETSRLIRDLEYKGDLYIYDLPEISRISSYYLTQLGKKFINVGHYNEIPNDKTTLFIATWSLSEVPFEYRNEIVEHFKNKDFLISFQNNLGYNNWDYFNNVFPDKAKVTCKLMEFGFFQPPHQSYYLICKGDKL